MKHMNTTFWSIPSSSLKPGKKFSEDIECFATENKTYLLGKGNLIFCCTGSWENHFRLVVQQSNNNPQCKGQQIEK